MTKQQKWHTHDERAEILATAEREGLSVEQVSERLGISRATFYAWRLSSGKGRTRAVTQRKPADSLAGIVRAQVQAKVSEVLPAIVHDEIAAHLQEVLGDGE
jgi:transposase-like protein